MGGVASSVGEDSVESGTRRLISAGDDALPSVGESFVPDSDDDCCRRRCDYHHHHHYPHCQSSSLPAAVKTEEASASRPAAGSGSRLLLSVSSPPTPIAVGGRTLLPRRCAAAVSDKCPALSASGTAAAWRHLQAHEVQQTSNSVVGGGATLAVPSTPTGVVSLRQLWLFACSLLFAGAALSLVSAALAVVSWRLLHEPTGGIELARNASAVGRAVYAVDNRRTTAVVEASLAPAGENVRGSQEDNATRTPLFTAPGCASPFTGDDLALPVA
ncbi:uncharacterized protein LOC144096981 [Amblyomma americanum]